MVKNHPDVEFHFIFDRPFDEKFIYGPNVVPHVLFPPARHPFLFIAWFDYALPRLLRKIKPDVFFSPDGYLSLRTDIPQVPVIHDINFFHYPEYFNFWVRWHFNTWFPQFAKKAEHIITISEFSKQDIAKNYRVDEKKITVAYNGIEQTPVGYTTQEIKIIADTYTSGKPYMIFIGALYPRKNLTNQLLAFDAFKEITNSDLVFVIVGKEYEESKSIFETYHGLKHKKDVIFTGRIDPRENLDKLLSGAIMNSYVSNFEGFGLPVLESMRAGVPVITGNNSALPEVASDAALLVDASSIEKISGGYLKLYQDASLRNILIEKGKEQIKKFIWDDTEKKVWEVLSQIRP